MVSAKKYERAAVVSFLEVGKKATLARIVQQSLASQDSIKQQTGKGDRKKGSRNSPEFGPLRLVTKERQPWRAAAQRFIL